ncbi:GNAT family N-acetyltransferase [Sporosarcina sp. UB5]|uniref:GNAT family N-acetyltransferase n=1 Tax=Sporosarcina sp. UB5 TaxID=3047463 RepID=UPI003D7A127C
MENLGSLKSKTIKGLWWSFADLMINHGIQFVIQIILARLLLPEHFGIIGMILIFIAISESIIESGFSQALIRDQHATQVDYSTVFHFNMIVSILLYLLIFLSAPIISDFFNEPQLVSIIRVLSTVLIIKSLGIVQRVLLRKKVDFKTMTKISFISVICSGTVTVVMAFMGYGVWSLVVNMILLQSGQTVFLWLFNRWYPSWTFNIQSFKRYFVFGYKLLLSGMIYTFYENLYFLIIGRLFTPNQLGYYTNAVKVKDLASMAIIVTVQRVTFPVLSSIQNDEERLKSGFRNTIKTAAYINFPLMIGLAAIAKPLFLLLLGEKWLPSVIYFQLLCFEGMLYPIHSLNLNILQVKGRSDLFLLLEVIKKIILTILIVCALYFSLGILGLIGAAVINSFISLLLNAVYSAKQIDYSSTEQLKDLLPSFLIAVIMGAIVHQFGSMLAIGNGLQLIVQISLGVIIYIGLSKLVKIQELKMIYELLLPFIKKTRRLIRKRTNNVDDKICKGETMELFSITSLEQLTEYEKQWSLILEENKNSNPFIEFPWIFEWWKHFGGNDVEILVVRSEGREIGFLPFRVKRNLFGYVYTFMAFGDANYMDMVIEEGRNDEVIAFVLDEVFRTKRNVVFYLHGLLESGKASRSLENYLRKRKLGFSVHRVITPYVDLEKIVNDEYMNKRQRLHRLSRREKRLRENGSIEILRSSLEEMDEIFNLHDKQWKKKSDTSGFSDEKKKEFYRSLACINEGPLKTEIDSLNLNGTIIAFSYGFKCRGRYLSYVLGFDTDFEVFSPGRILEKELILLCKKRKDRIFDLSIGYETYKFDWNTDEDFTRRMIFSSGGLVAKMMRLKYSWKETLIERIKKNYRLVLFKRNSMGKFSYVLRNLFNEKESVEARAELYGYLTRIGNFIYKRERHIVYKVKKINLPELPTSNNYYELNLGAALDNRMNTRGRKNDFCRKVYGGYRGYYTLEGETFDDVTWTNEKVLRIDSVPYVENFRRKSVSIENWKEGELKEICALIVKESSAGILYTTVREEEKTKIAELESIGFTAEKHVFKRTYCGFSKMIISHFE